ncbi:MAG: nucleoside recognition family protein [Gammaproteobacteria bacterium]|nr:MAG: nucleoside recognition family protein [Gammaproteobacteria bacterium]
MEHIINIILESGRTALDIALYTLLPIMVVMLALMKLLEAKGLLAWVANHLAPFVRIFGLPGLSLFAMLKLLFVSFSAPMATFVIMAKNGTSLRHIAATLAMVLTMSQANVIFPMVTVGLNLPVVLISSLIGGLSAAAFTYHVLANRNDWQEEKIVDGTVEASLGNSDKSAIQLLADGGQEGLKLAINAIPMLILAICLVTALRETGAMELFSFVLAPLLSLVGLPEVAVLPIVTKFIAGGTAFMGVIVDLMNQGQLTVIDLNRMAGFVINPLDIVGVSVILAAAQKLRYVAKVAIQGALLGLFVRGMIHLVWF